MLLSIHTFTKYVRQISRRFFELGLIAVERPCYLCRYMNIIAKHQLISQKYLLVDYRCRKRHLSRSRYMRVACLFSAKPVFLNLFRAGAHFRKPQIFAAHLKKYYNVILKMSLA